MDLVVELVDLVAELVMLMLLVLVLLPLLVVELMKQERSHKSSSHPSLRLVAGKQESNEKVCTLCNDGSIM